MRKIILILLIMSLQLFGQDNKYKVGFVIHDFTPDIVTNVKFKYPQKAKDFVKVEYFALGLDGSKVYDASSNPFSVEILGVSLSVNKKLNSKNVKLSYIDSLGHTYQRIKNLNNENVKVLHSSSQNLIKNENIDQKVWTIKDIETAKTFLYGLDKPILGKILLCIPDPMEESSNGVTLKIKSDVQLESLAIFTNNNTYATIATMNFFNKTIPDYISISMKKDGKIIIVGKGIDGKLYQVSHDIRFVKAVDNGNINCHY
ncbi:hypothetical protein MN086_03380 [Sulfurovum sp. XGS-02]|uniref:hypothetical protein n=1 Tax=Sulfurovum sp. XGS-02 TaxID=2925411 RepID=UPI00205C1B41|nr:hypothetical protein [Sulfurovum sp. XGS-02]UPT78194.1 hypothetical protein MN086_03380 [Sulfurovum sp. XGS-02]